MRRKFRLTFYYSDMPLTNNVMIVRHKLLTNLIKLWKDNQLVERIDRLPIELSPRTSRVLGRCCVHKERAVWKYKSFPLMGFDMSDETDELTPLSEYARKALERKGQQQKDNILCVIDEACSSCVQTNYEITNLCKGCVARACATNCPKNAIEFNRAGKAVINHDLCISCGICHSNCPYHAIVYMPVPCEEACPVKAITKDERGVEHIDESKCIYCGKCINSCPFGAIFEISQVFDVLQRLREGEKMVAVVAPAILGQYNAPTEKVYGAIKAIGFEDVIEVAQGAMETIRNEGAELEEKIEEGQAFMTTSCCPSWVELANKHIPEMKPFISSTGSPMYYAARIASANDSPLHCSCLPSASMRSGLCLIYTFTLPANTGLVKKPSVKCRQTFRFNYGRFGAQIQASSFAAPAGILAICIIRAL